MSKFGMLAAGGALIGATALARYFRKRERFEGASGFETLDEIQDRLEESFSGLVDQFVAEVVAEAKLPDVQGERIRELCEYTCRGGKMWRAKIVVTTTRHLCEAHNLSFSKRATKSLVLGWCIEILQACFLVADDIMDKSITRRGKPCWYKREDIQLDAINDTLILESFIYFLLKTYFGDESIYVSLIELYHDVSLQTQIGQMLDLTSQPQGRKGPDILHSFSEEMHRNIITFKTAFYTFYLPWASGMILCGQDSPQQMAAARRISIEFGVKFQIQDDYLDCFGDPEVMGKKGTDIQDHKCTWLVVQALQRASTSQKIMLEQRYGREDEASVSEVKALYRELRLKNVYDEQEESSKARIAQMIEESSALLPPIVFTEMLKKIHKREK